jgi:hypothetical protein
MSLAKLSLARNSLIIPGQGEFGKWHPRWDWENHLPFFTVQTAVQGRLSLKVCLWSRCSGGCWDIVTYIRKKQRYYIQNDTSLYQKKGKTS